MCVFISSIKWNQKSVEITQYRGEVAQTQQSRTLFGGGEDKIGRKGQRRTHTVCVCVCVFEALADPCILPRWLEPTDWLVGWCSASKVAEYKKENEKMSTTLGDTMSLDVKRGTSYSDSIRKLVSLASPPPEEGGGGGRPHLRLSRKMLFAVRCPIYSGAWKYETAQQKFTCWKGKGSSAGGGGGGAVSEHNNKQADISHLLTTHREVKVWIEGGVKGLKRRRKT